MSSESHTSSSDKMYPAQENFMDWEALGTWATKLRFFDKSKFRNVPASGQSCSWAPCRRPCTAPTWPKDLQRIWERYPEVHTFCSLLRRTHTGIFWLGAVNLSAVQSAVSVWSPHMKDDDPVITKVLVDNLSHHRIFFVQHLNTQHRHSPFRILLRMRPITPASLVRVMQMRTRTKSKPQKWVCGPSWPRARRRELGISSQPVRREP